MTTPVTTRVALYARVSTSDQNCEFQLRELRDYLSRRGWTIAGEFIDHDVSGAKDSRSELDKLMRSARRREFDVVVVWRFDRLARSVKHLVLAVEEFQSLGIGFVSYQEALDTSTPHREGHVHHHRSYGRAGAEGDPRASTRWGAEC